MTEYNWDLQTFWMEAMTRISSNTHEKLVPPQLCLFCVCSGSFAVKSGCFFSLIIYVQSKKRCFHETFETYHKSTWTFLWYFTGFTKLKLFPFPSFCCDCLALRSAEGNGNTVPDARSPTADNITDPAGPTVSDATSPLKHRNISTTCEREKQWQWCHKGLQWQIHSPVVMWPLASTMVRCSSTTLSTAT